MSSPRSCEILQGEPPHEDRRRRAQAVRLGGDPAHEVHGRLTERLGVKWYEDPLNEEDIYSYPKLRAKLDIPIMATEYPQGDLGTYAAWITERATDYLRGDIPVKGGLTTMLKAAHLAEAFGMTYEVYHGGNSLNNMAHCPQRPGIGAQIDFDLIKSKEIARLS